MKYTCIPKVNKKVNERNCFQLTPPLIIFAADLDGSDDVTKMTATEAANLHTAVQTKCELESHLSVKRGLLDALQSRLSDVSNVS